MNSSSKHRQKWQSLAVTVSVSGAALAYAVLVILPVQRSIGDTRTVLRTKQEAVVQSLQLLPAIEKEQQRLAIVQAYNDSWRERAPTERQMAGVLAEITHAAHAAGTQIVRLDPQPPRTMNLLVQAPVILAVEGSFAHVTDLIRRLEQMPPSIWIEQMQLGPAGKDGDLVRCEAVLVIFADNSEKSD